MEEEKPKNANDNCPGVTSADAGKASSCSGCPNQQKCLSGEAQKPDPILSGKGGVGKSTFSSQLSLILSKKEFEVGLLDVDICGPSIPRMMGLEGQEVHSSKQGWSPVYVSETLGVMSVGFMLPKKDEAVIWRGPRKNGLIQQFLTDVCWVEDEDQYLDFLVIDTPPGTSDEHISLVQFLSACQNVYAIVITTPQEVSLQDVRKELSFCLKTNTKILGVVENMSGFICPNCKCESQIFPPVTGGAEKMCQEYNIPLLGKIPLEPQVLLSAEKGKCITDECPNSVACKVYNEIIQKITKDLNIEVSKK